MTEDQIRLNALREIGSAQEKIEAVEKLAQEGFDLSVLAWPPERSIRILVSKKISLLDDISQMVTISFDEAKSLDLLLENTQIKEGSRYTSLAFRLGGRVYNCWVGEQIKEHEANV